MRETTTIYLVRHGQTEWNVQHRFQGHKDSPLTKLGIRQAEWLGEALQHDPFDFIFSSTSSRAYHTAELIKGNRNVQITACDKFREINLGVWEGEIQERISDMYPQQLDHFWNHPELFGVEGSETFHEVRERAVNKLNEIIASNPGSRILLVTHTVVVKLLVAYFEGRSLDRLWDLPYIHPTCLSKIELTDDVPSILLHGDVSHYREEQGV
ncbi:histidine phosphatase family protein [Paenibacillus sp. Y412MC10]|uniref:histidine phosphatase family protein n=1 Tax=Geobacillus sp. (strain Y412MC10) TaxID=481743 RepID=UPI0001788535|nr:histidine phosphatase family protein [Paenibacillus sp. Y412MC10]ACX66597.1 Phosphoglycerate mutase [Paenibacillus sp. Y412MC10]